MDRKGKITLTATAILLLLIILLVVEWQSSSLQRLPFSAPKPSFSTLEDILSHPELITIQTHSTGKMQIEISAIMNLNHDQAQDIENDIVEFPVTVNIIQHQEFGAFLIDAGLDASYVDRLHGTIEGILIRRILGKSSRKPNTHIAAILIREQLDIQGVWLTHLHRDHTAGNLDLPKDIPCFMGKNERYTNFTLFMQGDHLAGIDELYEIDFAGDIDLPPFGKGFDVFGDGSLWAISSSGLSRGHVIYFINGVEDKVLVTGDASNTLYQFESRIGPGYFSSDLEQAQDVLDQIIEFKELYPEAKLIFGHDLQSS